MSLDTDKIRKDFPILNQLIHQKYPLVYFDNGATTQKPSVVIDKINEYYTQKNSNIHRGIHYLSQQATEEYEEARKVVKEFINARSTKEIIFTNGTTSSINTVAYAFGEKFVTEGDEIIITEIEHHANIVPWQMLCTRKNAVLKYIPLKPNGELNIESLSGLITHRTKLISVSAVSNALGTIIPVEKIIYIAHQHHIPVLLDCAQSVQHSVTDVQKLDADMVVFSGHKIYGPTGIGVLYGKESLLTEMPPFMGGGDMVDQVTMEKTTFNDLPFKFEAGTTNYIAAIAMAEAIKYVQDMGMEKIAGYEHSLLQYATENLNKLGGITIYGNSPQKAPIISFLIDGVHPLDAGMVLDKLGIAIRTGTHCAQPVMNFFGIDGTMRAAFSFYNTVEEIDRFIDAIKRVKIMFS